MRLDLSSSRIVGFDTHPALVKDIYHNLDESNQSEFHGGLEVHHKTIFATMLTLICNDQGQEKKPERWKTHIIFDLTENHRVDSDLAFGDALPDKYNLTLEVFELGGS